MQSWHTLSLYSILKEISDSINRTLDVGLYSKSVPQIFLSLGRGCGFLAILIGLILCASLMFTGLPAHVIAAGAAAPQMVVSGAAAPQMLAAGAAAPQMIAAGAAPHMIASGAAPVIG